MHMREQQFSALNSTSWFPLRLITTNMCQYTVYLSLYNALGET